MRKTKQDNIAYMVAGVIVGVLAYYGYTVMYPTIASDTSL